MTEIIKELQPFLQQVWEKSEFNNPTEIQKQAIPFILEGKDVIAESPTGTGKTLAYLLPILNQIDTENKNAQVLIMASSQELVMQIHQEVQKWTAGSGIKSGSFIGGANVKRQVEKLKQKPHVISGTPGRIQELIKIKKLKMHEVKTVVFDEGDQLLLPEHKGTIEDIVKSTLSDRQLMLFSATLPEHVENTAKALMDNPEVIKVKKTEDSMSTEHIYIMCEQREKIEYLRKIGRLPGVKGIAFMKDIGNLTVVAEKLEYMGFPVGVLHSDSKKQEREKAIKAFRENKINLLLATDVAARGLDVKGITHVIHVDLPREPLQYVHRSGRTGRLGSTTEGTVISIINAQEEKQLMKIARELNLNLEKKVMARGQILDNKKRNK